MRTFAQYVPQCRDPTVSPEKLCGDAPWQFFTPRGREWVWNLVSAQSGKCKKPYLQLTTSFMDNNKLQELLVPIHHPKCTFSFRAEVGDYEIIVVANTTITDDILVQKFRVKV